MEGYNKKGKIYTAITIGPISKTFDKARKVKARWSASYMFSWIMRQLLRELVQRGYADNIISPHYDAEGAEEDLLSQVGLFPDRAIIEGKVEGLEEIKDKVIGDLARKMLGKVDDKDKQAIQNLENYLKSFISIYYDPSIHHDSSQGDPPGAGFIEKLNSRLDALELRQKAATKEDTQFKKLLANNNGFINGYLHEQKKGPKKVPFETTSRIAVSGWLNDEDIEEYTIKESEDPEGDKGVTIDYVRLSKEKSEEYRNCYKYLAVVKADGDSFGKFINKLTAEQMKEFSKYFFDFSLRAAKELKKLKAVPVYIGGDDLFFFAPILSTDRKQIFALIEVVEKYFKVFRDELVEKHKTLFEELEKQIKVQPLTMSYGVSIFYYKSPMSEAIEVAGTLLDQAKGSGRDRVAVSIHKHSGRKIEFTLPCKYSTKGEKEQQLYNEAIRLIETYSTDAEEAMLDGLMHWLDEMFDLVIVPILQGEPDAGRREQRLLALCKNFFDEDIHKGQNKHKFLERVFRFIAHLADESYTIGKIKPLVYGVLRYCQFITDKEER